MGIAFCDDEKFSIKELERLVKKYYKQKGLSDELLYFSTPSELFAYMQEKRISLIFMDLEFCNSSEDGIEWSKKIKRQFPQTAIIILTVHEKRYKEGFVADAFRFMTKPVIEQELFENLDDFWQQKQLNETVSLSHRGTPYEIPLQDIYYLSAQSGGSELWTCSNMFSSEESLIYWETRLPDNIFFRCHKKYLINLTHVIDFNNHFCTLINGEKIPISRRKWKEFQIAYIKYDIHSYRFS